jgi:ABC-type polysaccharide/polyol phosphate transport system ATPase subunit
MALAAGHIKFLAKTTDDIAMRNSRRRAIIPGSKDMPVINQYCADLPAQAAGTLAHQIRHLHEIFVPLRPAGIFCHAKILILR